MSRRKQPKPRHIETEDEIAHILQKDFKEMPGESQTPNDDTPTLELPETDTEVEAPLSPSPQGGDAHVCGKCREEFIGLSDFIAHKKVCSKKKVVVFFDANENENYPVHDRLGFERYRNLQEVGLLSEEGSDGEGNMDQSEEEDENDLQIDENGVDEDLKFSRFNGDSADDDDDDENDSDNDGDDSENDRIVKELENRALIEKYELANQFQNFMFPFSQFMPNNNVVLEPLGATKAAVAQFAENNLSPSDLAVLHTTLYSLQQQQLVQLQLIQQLQQQLLMGGSVPSIPNGYLPLLSPNSFNPPSSTSVLPITSSTSSMNDNHEMSEISTSASMSEPANVTSSATSAVSSATTMSKNSTSPPLSNNSSPPPTSSAPQSSSVISSVTSSTISSSTTTSTSSVPVSLPLPSTGLITSSSSSSSTPTSGFARLSKMVEHSQYVSDDPFFRHKCRMCHKVFGSDSALQIHIRSHTGERPFKCNICGNRFSTRGNLKVHFDRHKLKHPHVKMNPNPVPEYLDKLPMQPLPFMGPSFLGGAPMPSSLPNSMFHVTPSLSAPIFSYREEPLPMLSKSMSEDHQISSPNSSTKSPLTSPLPTANISDATERKSPSLADTASLAVSSSISPSSKVKSEQKMMTSTSLPHVTPSHFPLLSPLPSSVPPPPPLTPTLPFDPPSRESAASSAMLESHVSDETLEQFMEIDKSETSKLQQLVDNIENKMTDPNQCVICHRVLSCKSALQMHYRTHTGERPFRCKICNRAFTTKGNLKTHMGVHRMKPPLRMMHQCPVCHKSFTNLLVLQQHIRSHAGVPGPLPGMSHFQAFPHPPAGWPLRPFDLPGNRMNHSVNHLNPEKELDLSKSSSLFNTSNDKNEEHREDVNNNDGDESGVDEYVDEEEMLEDQLTDEKEKDLLEFDDEHPSGDSGAGSEEGRPGSAEDMTKTQTNNETNHCDNNANQSDCVSEDSGRSASPKFDDRSPINPESSMFSSLANSHSTPIFSTSLAALEERVRAIDSSMAQSPLNRFRPAFALNGGLSPLGNGVRSPSPGSQYGSESGSEGVNDRSTPGTPALSIRSDCSSAGSGIGILDLRGSMDKSTTCSVCYKAFACRSALEIHLRSHTKERPYKCQVCDRHFSTKGNMRQHMLTHKIRDLPASSFNNDSENNDSNSRTSDNGAGGGGGGGNNSDMPPEKKPKLDSEHSGQNSNGIVNKCDSSPFIRSDSTPHKHTCQVCNKGFSSQSALQIHFRTHTGDKPFKCLVCGKAFTTKGNLKVHRGTHMYTNSPSRRGRRMSIEPPFMMSHKDNPYMPPGFPPRAPEFFPFHFPPFLSGPSPPKLNEISVIQNLASGMGHFPPMSTAADLTSPKTNSDSQAKSEGHSWSRDSDKHESKLHISNSGELDLSMKSSSSGSPTNNTSSENISSWSSWKTSCHLCNKSFPSPTALEHHMQSYHLSGQVHKSVVA